MQNMKTENEILESRELRNELLSRTEVLAKVKTLFLLPKLQMMSMAQVAEYYEVDVEAIRKCFQRNREEIESDGSRKMVASDIGVRLGQNVPIKNHRGFKEFDLGDGVTFRMPNVGMIMFPKRAILRIGMLLRDSEIAKEVRTQLINTFEEADEKQRTAQLNEEQNLVLKLIEAFQAADHNEMLRAAQTLYQFQNRHIAQITEENEEIKTDNQMLAGEILKWTDRSQINRVVRFLSSQLNTPYQYIWKELYTELSYKHGMDLSKRKLKRKNDSRLSTVKESEWPVVQQSLAALCEKYGFSPEKLYKKALKHQM